MKLKANEMNKTWNLFVIEKEGTDGLYYKIALSYKYLTDRDYADEDYCLELIANDLFNITYSDLRLYLREKYKVKFKWSILVFEHKEEAQEFVDWVESIITAEILSGKKHEFFFKGNNND
jgi:hypothetical protein